MKRWLTLVVLLRASVALGHPLNPALLELRELAGGEVEVRWRMPAAQGMNAPLRPVLPPQCENVSTPEVSLAQAGQSLNTRSRVRCAGAGLVGARIAVEGLAERQTEALLRVTLRDGRTLQAVLRGGDPAFTVPARAGALAVLRAYGALGLSHILSGLDHLLFVLGLVLLVDGRRRLLWTVTAFTAGHSVTLSLAALGVVHVPTRAVEIAIAASIFVVALELSRAPAARGIGRWPWLMAFVFGLLHGLGFAGALAQVGLPVGEIPLALFSFNVGIEAGQLAFVVAVLMVRAVVRSRMPRWMEAAPAYVIGSTAVMWMLDRWW